MIIVTALTIDGRDLFLAVDNIHGCYRVLEEVARVGVPSPADIVEILNGKNFEGWICPICGQASENTGTASDPETTHSECGQS